MTAGDWTQEEQLRLEEGLVNSATIIGHDEKWRAIAQHVGTRDEAACRQRLNYCRKLAREDQRRAAGPSPEASPSNSEDEQDETEETADARENTGSSWARSGGRWGSRGWRSWNSAWHDTQWTQGDDAWNASGSGWNSTDDWRGSESWQDAGQEEEQAEEMTEEERRAMELRREVEANRERLRKREEQQQFEESQRQKKKQAEGEEREKKKRDYAEEQERKKQEAAAKKRQLQEQALEEQRKAKEEADRTDIPFFGPRPSPALPKSNGSAAVAAVAPARGWASKASAKKAQAQRQRKQEEMERKAAEAMANIAGTKAGSTSTVVVEESSQESSDEEFVAPAPVEVVVPQPSQPVAKAAVAKGKAMPSPQQGATQQATPEKAASSKGGGKGGPNRPPKKRWWHKIDGDCAISLAPICELPQPPFALTVENSSAVHYYDARFLASFLVSSCDFIDPANRRPLTHEECVMLDDHLRRYHPEHNVSSVADAFDLFDGRGHSSAAAGDDQVQREATAVLQHLFRFGSHRRTDARGRAVNYSEAGLTVVDDDDILATADTGPAAAPPRQPGSSEGPDYPTLSGNAGSAGGSTSAAWRNRQTAAAPSAAESYPSLPSSKPKGPPPKAAAKASDTSRGQASGGKGGRGKGGPGKQHQLRSGPKAWGAPR